MSPNKQASLNLKGHFLSHYVCAPYPERGFWTQKESNLQKTVKRPPKSLFKALALAAGVTQTLRESETWGESPWRYCALCEAALSN